MKLVFLAIILQQSLVAISAKKCPCKEEAHCDPISRPPGKEFMMFSTKSQEWRKYQWTKVTTIAVFRDWDDELMCYAHSKVVMAALWLAFSRLVWKPGFKTDVALLLGGVYLYFMILRCGNVKQARCGDRNGWYNFEIKSKLNESFLKAYCYAVKLFRETCSRKFQSWCDCIAQHGNWNIWRRCMKLSAPRGKMLFATFRETMFRETSWKGFTKPTVLHDTILGETCIALQFHEKKFHRENLSGFIGFCGKKDS